MDNVDSLDCLTESCHKLFVFCFFLIIFVLFCDALFVRFFVWGGVYLFIYAKILLNLINPITLVHLNYIYFYFICVCLSGLRFWNKIVYSWRVNICNLDTTRNTGNHSKAFLLKIIQDDDKKFSAQQRMEWPKAMQYIQLHIFILQFNTFGKCSLTLPHKMQ